MDSDAVTQEQAKACGYAPNKILGQGTYGIVYEVNDSGGETFAFKYIRGHFDRSKYGIQDIIEIDILSRIQHPHIIHAASIVTPYNCEIDGMAVVLPLADQTFRSSLYNVIMTTDDKILVLFKLASALEFMHANGVLHLDIKGDNVVMQGTTPYFIDFGLSILCDDTTEGRHSSRTRVTITHRAPEILRGGTKYNAAVDVWSFGIMFLRAFGGKDMYAVNHTGKEKEKDLLNYITISAPNSLRFDSLLLNVRPHYRAPLKDLLLRMLELNPVSRISAKEIVNHPLFNSVRSPIVGTLVSTPIASDYARDHRDILKLLVKWMRDFFSVARVVTLFLAIDLFNRTSSHYKERSVHDRLALAATCVWMSGKLSSYDTIPLPHFVSKITPTVATITERNILTTEVEVISIVNGVLYDLQLYRAADNVDQLTNIFTSVVMSPNSQLYAQVNIPAYIQQLREVIPQPLTSNKNIKISDFFQ